MVGRAKGRRKLSAAARRRIGVAVASSRRRLGKARRKYLPPAEAARLEAKNHGRQLSRAIKRKLPASQIREIRRQQTRASVRAAKAKSLEKDANILSVIKFGSNMKTLFQNPDFSDITFVVHGQRVFAHKNILAAQCEYFNVLFKPQSPFAESGCSEIEVTEWSHNAFMAVLEWLYTCHTPTDQAPQSLREVASIADRYILPELKAVCGAILKRQGQPSWCDTLPGVVQV
jgi:hypothetical protein